MLIRLVNFIDKYVEALSQKEQPMGDPFHSNRIEKANALPTPTPYAYAYEFEAYDESGRQSHTVFSHRMIACFVGSPCPDAVPLYRHASPMETVSLSTHADLAEKYNKVMAENRDLRERLDNKTRQFDQIKTVVNALASPKA